MNKEQLLSLESLSQEQDSLSIVDMKDKKPRTLLWGYTCDRSSFHVYIDDDRLHRLIYNHDQETLSYASGSIATTDLTPNKRLYPEACDFSFCLTLRSKGLHLPFTTFRGDRKSADFYGLKKGDLNPIRKDLKVCRQLNEALQNSIAHYHKKDTGIHGTEIYSHDIVTAQINSINQYFLAFMQGEDASKKIIRNIENTQDYFESQSSMPELSKIILEFRSVLRDTPPPQTVN